MKRILVALHTIALCSIFVNSTAVAQLAGTTAEITSLSGTVTEAEPGIEEITASGGATFEVDDDETLNDWVARFSLYIKDFSNGTIGSETGSGVTLHPGDNGPAAHSPEVSLTTDAVYGSGPYTIEALAIMSATEDQMEFLIVGDDDSIIVY